MKTALTIAGSDPTGRAGIQAYLYTFLFFGIRGFSAVTAVTAQTETLVRAVAGVSARMVKEQIEAVISRHAISAVKVGMLATAENAKTVAAVIKKRRLKNIVLDPVLFSTGGKRLIEKKGVAEVKKLLPLAAVLTPNIMEAEFFSGLKIRGIAGMEEAAEKIHCLGPGAVLVKGGHLKGNPVDVLYDGKRFYRFEGRRIKAGRAVLHGTGCLLSSAIAAGLARGYGVTKAVGAAKRYVEGVVRGRR